MNSKAFLQPKQAILIQCRYCLNTQVFNGCDSTVCNLNSRTLSNLKKIKAHCLDCIGATSAQTVRKCGGNLLNGKTCSLHPFRLGHNPRREGIGGKKPNSRTFLAAENDA